MLSRLVPRTPDFFFYVLLISVLMDAVILSILCFFESFVDVSKYKGDNYTMKCPPHADALGVSLFTRRSIMRKVFYYNFSEDLLTPHKDYEGRVKVKNDKKTITIDIFNLELEDTGSYWCTYTCPFEDCEMDDSGVFLLVQGEHTFLFFSLRFNFQHAITGNLEFTIHIVVSII